MNACNVSSGIRVEVMENAVHSGAAAPRDDFARDDSARDNVTRSATKYRLTASRGVFVTDKTKGSPFVGLVNVLLLRRVPVPGLLSQSMSDMSVGRFPSWHAV